MVLKKPLTIDYKVVFVQSPYERPDLKELP
jgi:hypothetical protein